MLGEGMTGEGGTNAPMISCHGQELTIIFYHHDYHSYRVVHVTMSVKKNSSQGHLAVVYGGFPQGMGQSLRETICSLSRKVIQTQIGGQVRPCAVTWFRTIYLCRLRRRQAPYGVVVGPLSIDEVSEDIYMLV